MPIYCLYVGVPPLPGAKTYNTTKGAITILFAVILPLTENLNSVKMRVHDFFTSAMQFQA